MHGLEIYSTCPPLDAAHAAPLYPEHAASSPELLREFARASQEAGCTGALVVTDNAQLDPWLVAQLLIEATTRFAPLVAVQPVYMHPYSVAKMLASLAFLHGRRVHLNLVAGGFKNDLAALNDTTPHDERYARLLEYATIIQRLVSGPQAVSFAGRYYTVTNLKLTPALPAELRPELLMSGSSAAGAQAARDLGATAIEYPKPPAECASAPAGEVGPRGIRIGIIARATQDEAWAVAHGRYPEDRKGQLAHQLATKVSDSVWHRQLSELAEQSAPQARAVYWLGPFQNYKAVCPFLVGSHAQVAEEIARYIAGGYRTFILDVPATGEEMRHVGKVFARAAGQRLAA
jgi:alkanesulfonate monooxygenase